jgi:hypothetical protein
MGRFDSTGVFQMNFKSRLIVGAATFMALFTSLLIFDDLTLWQIGILGGVCGGFGLIVEKFLRKFNQP